jgi:hypothetical protein
MWTLEVFILLACIAMVIITIRGTILDRRDHRKFMAHLYRSQGRDSNGRYP